MKRLGSTRKLAAFNNIRLQLAEQTRVLEARAEATAGVAGELQDYCRRRADLEHEYARALDKLARAATQRHKDHKHKRDQWPLTGAYACWQAALDSTDARACRATTRRWPSCTAGAAARLQRCAEDALRLHRKCRDIVAERHEEAANATLQRYYLDDIADIVLCMEWASRRPWGAACARPPQPRAAAPPPPTPRPARCGPPPTRWTRWPTASACWTRTPRLRAAAPAALPGRRAGRAGRRAARPAGGRGSDAPDALEHELAARLAQLTPARASCCRVPRERQDPGRRRGRARQAGAPSSSRPSDAPDARRRYSRSLRI
uniref:FCH domain-containing protein n=1 Tax=Heliothis virescens TaxID=7102 RepID=A0A2A4K2A0_HELVI